ncbi:TraB/GumN family protein [Paracoccaceae bacterium Fryx2]|nr:TraB/GumN family protein [Paracoccaceae bacterium Fryx2]
MPRLLASLAALLLIAAAPLRAECVGRNLIETAPPAMQAQLDAALAGQPFAEGNLWQARRGDQIVTLVGTYHFPDPRHDALLNRVSPLLAEAKTLLVEAGPDEEAALKAAMGRDPGLMLITEGPSLLEQMGPDDWKALAAAMQARGVPSVMAARFKPWYVSVMLAIPPCAMEQAKSGQGLDKRITDLAVSRGLPVRALEPWNTVLTLFDAMPAAEQLSMIHATLPLEGMVTDMSVTLGDAYFAQDSRRVWEYMRLVSYDMQGATRAEVDAEFSRMEDTLMIARNRAWLPVIEAALADGPVVAAFGALHMSGPEGVAALLERAGFTLTRLPI